MSAYQGWGLHWKQGTISGRGRVHSDREDGREGGAYGMRLRGGGPGVSARGRDRRFRHGGLDGGSQPRTRGDRGGRAPLEAGGVGPKRHWRGSRRDRYASAGGVSRRTGLPLRVAGSLRRGKGRGLRPPLFALPLGRRATWHLSRLRPLERLRPRGSACSNRRSRSRTRTLLSARSHEPFRGSRAERAVVCEGKGEPAVGHGRLPGQKRKGCGSPSLLRLPTVAYQQNARLPQKRDILWVRNRVVRQNFLPIPA
jgi:hypothetical protein